MKKEASAETLTWLPDASEMARRIGAHDWAATPLGPIMEWPQALRFTVQLILGSDATMVAPWGPDGILLYNDAYSRLIGPRSSTALGRPVFDVFPELRAVLEPQFDEVRAGRAVKVADQPYPFVRTTDLEPAWFDVSHSAVRDENGAIAGILTILTETTNRVDADRQLRESEARHRYLIGSWAQAVWETDAEGVVIADSPSWRAYTGQTLEEWQGYGWLDAIHPDDRAYAERQWREAVAIRGLVDAEFRLRAPDGGWRWTNVRATPLLDGGGTIEKWVGMNIDIDARKRAEGALRESETKYRTVFEAIDEGFVVAEVIYDAQGRPVDALYIEGNRAASVLTGGRAYDHTLFSDLVPDAERYWVEIYDRVARTGIAERLEKFLSPLGRWYNFQVSRVLEAGGGHAPRIAVVFQDVTDRKRAEEALRTSEKRLRDVLNSMAEGFALFDSDFTILDVNDETLRLDGRSREELVGRSHWDAFPDTEHSALGDLYKRSMRERTPGSLEHMYHWPDGRMMWVDVSVYPNADGRLACFWRDITERKRVEAALRDSEARLAHDLEATQVLQDIGNQLISKPGVIGHFNELCEAARTLMRSDCASIQAYDDAGARLKLVGHVGFHPDSATFWEWVDAGVGSSCGRALANGERVIVPDMDLFEADPPDLEAYQRSAILSVQSTPLVARTGQIVGMMSTHWHRRDVPAEASYRYFDILTRLAADFIVRTRAEAALRQSEERQAFLVRFSDAVRGLPDPVEVATTACRMLLEQLDVDRAHWSEVDWATEEFVTMGSVHSPGVAPIEGRFPLAGWEPYSASHQEGRPVIVDDTQTDPRTDGAMRAATARMEIGADLAAPVLVEGRLASVLAVKQRQPRRWTREEIALVEGVAGRCWAEVGRARAEAALRASEAKYRTLFESMGQGYSAIEMIHGPDGRPIDHRLIDLNPAFERLTGIRVTDAIGRTATEVTPGMDPWWFETYDRIAHQGYPERVEYELTALGRWYEAHCVPQGGERLTVLYDDITARKRAEQQKDYLLKLSDALRPLADPAQIKLEAARVLGEELGVNRALYAEVVGENWWAERGYVRDVDPLPTGAYSSDTYGHWIMQIYRRGESLVFEDVRADSRFTKQQRAAAESASIIGAVGVPLVKSGDLVALLSVHTAQPHKWTAHEIAIVEETAERTWAAVERAKAEEALRASEERYRSLFDTMSEGVAINELVRDDAGHVVDARYLALNAAYQAQTGFDARSAIGRRASEVFPEYYRDWLRIMEGVVRAGRAERFEHFVADNQRWFSFVAVPFGGPDAFAVFYDNITERKRAEEALRASEERLRRVLDGMGEGFGLLAPDFTILEHNREALRMDGRAREEVVGRSHWEVYPGSEDSELGRLLKKAMAERVPVSLEHRYAWQAGRALWLGMRAYPTSDGSLAVFWSDVTERRHAQDALQQAHDSLETRVRERTAEVQSLFTRLVSAQEEERRRIARDIHDQLGQQMTAVRMSIQALRSQSDGHVSLVEQAERAQQLAEELDQSIDFLTWQLRPAALDHLGLSAALRNLVTGWSERFGVEAAFDVAGVEDVRLPRDVEANLYRVAQEALHNVAKHAEATHVTVFVTQQEGELVLVVEDNGRGFDPATKRESVDGSGLGLASMRERAALMGGRLEIESVTGLGTTIYVRLPELNGSHDRH